MPGPIPKRSSQRLSKDKSRNDNIEKVPSITSDTTELKQVDDSWNSTMKTWFSSLVESGQSRFYQPSDWATARMWCDIMTREMSKKDGASASMVSQFNIVASSLLTTEGARRRARMEITSPDIEQEVHSAHETLDDELDSILGI